MHVLCGGTARRARQPRSGVISCEVGGGPEAGRGRNRKECGSRPQQTASRAREDRGIFGRPRGGWRRAFSTIGRRGVSRPTRFSSNAPSRRPCTSSPKVSSGRLSSSPPCDTVGVKSGTQNATWWADPSCAWMLLGHAVTGLAHAGVLPRNTLEGAPTSSVGDRGTTLGPVA